MTSSWTVKDKCYKIRFLTLGHTVDSGRKRTVFKNLGRGAILGTWGKFYQPWGEETRQGNSR